MEPKKKMLILHGWEGNPNFYWFPKAKEKFEKLGYEVFTPHMPGAYFPKKDEWLKKIGEFHPGPGWVLMGHSLGGVAIMKYLEQCDEVVDQVVLIATPFDPMKFEPIVNFFDKDFDWDSIKKHCKNFAVLNESNDSAVPAEHAKNYAKALGVEALIVPGYSHFNKLDLDLLVKAIA